LDVRADAVDNQLKDNTGDEYSWFYFYYKELEV
jgi:hypothetical protein